MVVVIVLRHPDTGTRYLENVCKYTAKKEECIYISGFGVDYHNLERAYKQMMCVKKHFSKTSGNQVVHIIVSFGETVRDDETAINMGRKIASYYSGRHQIVWGVHHLEREESMYHLHIIINSVSYADGKMFDSNKIHMNVFCDFIKVATGDEYYLEFQST